MKDFKNRNYWIGKGATNVLSNNYTIMFVMGKGAGLVPVVVPKDCERACELLVNSNNRSVTGLSPTNKFLFGYMKDSCDNITGYNEIIQTCKKDVNERICFRSYAPATPCCGPFGRPGKHGVKTYTLIEGAVRQRAVHAFPLRGAGTKRLFEDVSSCSADDSMEPQRKWEMEISNFLETMSHPFRKRNTFPRRHTAVLSKPLKDLHVAAMMNSPKLSNNISNRHRVQKNSDVSENVTLDHNIRVSLYYRS